MIFKKTFIFTAAILFLSSPSFSGAAERITGISIRPAAEEFHKTSVEQIASLLPFRAGNEFSPDKLNEGIDALRKWGIFEDINVSTEKTAGGIEIYFVIREAILIGEINISGNYPYIERKIKKYLTIRAGDIYTRDKVEEQIKRITDFYEREGFINTKVTSKEEWNEYTGDVIVTFRISRGSVIRYGDIFVTGEKAYPAGRVISAIDPLRRYKPMRLNDAIRSLEDFYKKKGFPRARIEVVKKDFNYDARRLNLHVSVIEGPRVDIEFVGNRGVSGSKLKKAVTVFDEGSFDEFEIEESAVRMVKLYKRYGYDEAEVQGTRKEQNNGNYTITFYIKEGPKHSVKSVDFSGDPKFSNGRLKKQLKTKELSLVHGGVFNKGELEDDLKSLKKFYESEGYLNADIGAPSVNEARDGITITIPVDSDGRTLVKQINLNGSTTLRPKKLLKRLKNRVGRPFDATAMEVDKQALLTFLGDHGYPYASAEISYKADGGEATIDIDINEGPKVTIGEVLVVGNSLTATKSIRKAVSLKSGDPFSAEKIMDSQFALRRMGAFNSASIETIGLREKEKVVHLKVKVEETKPFMLDVSAGYSTDQLFTGSMIFTNLNSFGRAKRSNLALTGGSKLSRGELSWSDPRLFGTDLDSTASTWLQYENQNVFMYVQVGGGFGVYRRYHRTGLMAKYELMRNYFVKGDSTAADAQSLRNNTLSKISLSASFDTRNSFSDPSRGIFTMGAANFYNEIGGQHANFVKLRWTLGNFFGFFTRFNFTSNVKADTIQTFGNNISVPSNELLLLGGETDLRGFSRYSLGPVDAAGKATGGRARLIYNAELLFRLFGNFKLAGFYDVGELTNGFTNMTWGQIKQDAGAGLRYFTPVGPLKFDYAFVINRKSGEDKGRFTFSFGYMF